jgi:hypothetical protein
MSVSQTSFHPQQTPSTVSDDTDKQLPNTDSGRGKKRSAEALSSFSIGSLVNSRESGAVGTRSATQSSTAGAPSISTPKRLMDVSSLVNASKQPMPVDLDQVLSSITLPPQPVPSSSGITPPTPYFPSSYPVLQGYLVWPNQPLDQVSMVPPAPAYMMTHSQFKLPQLEATTFAMGVLTPPPFQSSNDVYEDVDNNPEPESLTEIDDEQPTKRRKTDEGTNSDNDGPSRPRTARFVWHQNNLVVEKNLDPYIKFLGLSAEEGNEFLRTIFYRNEGARGMNSNERVDFCEKLFLHLPTAIEQRRLGTNDLSDNQLGKLIVSSLLLIKTNVQYTKGDNKRDLSSKLFGLVHGFINNNHDIAHFIKTGVRLDRHAQENIFGGKAKCELILWCAEQGISLNQQELNFLSKGWFTSRTPPGYKLLQEFRTKLKQETILG